jgi:hypothetical protein
VADGPAHAQRRGIAVRRAWRALVFGLAAAAPAPVACSSNPSDGRTGTASLSPTEGSGEIRMQLTLPGGEDLSTIAYNLTNGTPEGTVTGTYVIPISAVSADFEVPSVPEGTGYGILLTATSSDGTVTCEGSDPATLPVSDASPGFAVSGGVVTVVNLVLTCTEAVDGGGG